MTAPASEPVVHGRISSRRSASVGGLKVEVIDRNIGADRTVAETTTNPDGSYSTAYPREKLGDGTKTRADLQVAVAIGGSIVARSNVRYNASDDEQLDVLLPDNAPLPSEHETVQAAIAAVFPGALSTLQENDDRQDITYLANKTGWDARAIAMAAPWSPRHKYRSTRSAAPSPHPWPARSRHRSTTRYYGQVYPPTRQRCTASARPARRRYGSRPWTPA